MFKRAATWKGQGDKGRDRMLDSGATVETLSSCCSLSSEVKSMTCGAVSDVLACAEDSGKGSDGSDTPLINVCGSV